MTARAQPFDDEEEDDFGLPAAAPVPPGPDTGRDDGLLDSLGKAVASPVAGAAEDDEPSSDAKKPPQPPG